MAPHGVRYPLSDFCGKIGQHPLLSLSASPIGGLEQGPIMVDIPAYCSNCGLLFPSGFAATNVRNTTFTGNKQTCPRCGDMAVVLEGVFNVADDLIEIIQASDFTVEVLQKFQALISRPNVSAEIDTVAQSAEEIHPGLGNVVRKANKTGVWLFLIAAVIALSKIISVDFHVDINKLIDQVTTDQSQDIDRTQKNESTDDTDPTGKGP